MWTAHDPGLIQAFAGKVVPVRLGVEGRVVCEPWREGASNAIWKLDIGPLKAVLKIGKNQGWRRQDVEAAVLRRFAGRGAPAFMAGGVAGADLPWDWSVLERVEGEHPYEFDTDDVRGFAACLAELRQVDFGGSLTFASWTDFVRDRIETPLEKAENAPASIRERFLFLIGAARRYDGVGASLDSSTMGVVHGDVIPLNVLREPNGRFRILDWENPRLGSVAWDLAGIRKAFKLAPGAWEAAKAGLGGGLPDSVIDFADALQQLQVAAWRAETWWGRGDQVGGAFFLQELEWELDAAERLLSF